MKRRFDAVVIGGGPAGALSALQLAQLGWSVLLVERGGRNRTKTCGHCLNARALRILGRFDLADDVRRIATQTTTNLRVHQAHAQQMFCTPISEGLQVERSEFDQLLRDHAAKAGVFVLHGASARLLPRREDGAHLIVRSASATLQISTRLAIGADGVGSQVARLAGLAGEARHGRKYGFSFDVAIPSVHSNGRHAIEMFLMPGGYLGMIREAGRLHLAGLVSSQMSPLKREPLAFTRWAARRHRGLSELGLDRLAAGAVEHLTAIGPMPWQPARIADATTALVGDAASFIEPFTGEGMGWALLSAEALGQAAGECKPGGWDEHVALKYSAAWANSVYRKQRLCRMIAPILARPLLSMALFKLGNHVQPVARRIISQAVA